MHDRRQLAARARGRRRRFVVLAATHERALDNVPLEVLEQYAVDVPADPGRSGAEAPPPPGALPGGGGNSSSPTARRGAGRRSCRRRRGSRSGSSASAGPCPMGCWGRRNRRCRTRLPAITMNAWPESAYTLTQRPAPALPHDSIEPGGLGRGQHPGRVEHVSHRARAVVAARVPGAVAPGIAVGRVDDPVRGVDHRLHRCRRPDGGVAVPSELIRAAPCGRLAMTALRRALATRSVTTPV